jgi:hypothetical protein
MRLLPRSRRGWVIKATMAALVAGTAVTTLSAPASAQYTAACPAAGSISQEWSSGHDGIDIANGYGTPIYAVGPGRVTFSATADPNGYGQYINILHDDGSMTQYGHMRRRLVFVNDRVNAGQQIAEMGSEGSSTGPHLHLRTYARNGDARGINPRNYLSARGISMPCTPGGNPQPGNFSTWGSGIRVRQQPSTSAGVVTTFGGPTRVQVQCQKHAEMVHAEGYSNDAWSHLTSPVNGWISNIYIDNPAAWLPGIPDCGSNTDKPFRTWGTSVNIRQQPSTSAGVVRNLTGPTDIKVHCQKHAEMVHAEGYSNDAWTYLSSPVVGWVSNIYVDDPAAWLPGVPTC